jgi:hypothetical protein
MFLGANPAEVPSGPRAGLRTLAAEEDLARALMAALPDAERKKAVIAAEAPRDIITGPGQKIDLGEPAGLAAADMSIAARRLLWELITEYARNLQPEVAAKELAEIRGAGLRQIHFAWSGSTGRGEGHYYRIHGPTFIIEYDNTQNNANHIHTVWHSLNNDFGLDTLRRHYQGSSHHAAGH